MAGLTENGLTIKRLPDVITSMRGNAITVFQDLVSPGDVVDTSDSSTIGRIIGLVSNDLADLWESLQEVYWAYDPNSATGIALDNIVMQAGITRRGETPTTADIYIEGNPGGLITAGMQARSRLTGETYRVVSPVSMSPDNSLGIGVSISTPVTDGVYTIVYTPSHSATPFTISVPRAAGETQEQAFRKIELEVEDNHPLVRTYRRDQHLFLIGAIEYQLFDFSVTTPLNIDKVVVDAVVRGTNPGPITESENDINIIATPSLYWDHVWNPFAASPGSFRESDEDLRIRFRNTKFQRGTNIIESLYTALYDINGVSEVKIIENDSDIVDEYGNPAHSFMVLVQGGLNSAIAQAIWRNRPVGIRSNGDISVNILDSFGYIREVLFSRPSYLPIYVEMSLTKGLEFPVDGEDQIREAIIRQVNSYGIGDDVIYSRLYTPINSVQGHQVDSLSIGVSVGDTSAGNILVDFNQKPIISKENIIFV